ncbi:MAG: hypothetical protein GY774_04700 [Planctomycetes bacterium]|nr:hypothetical protein [Planctomycetota bacterium]
MTWAIEDTAEEAVTASASIDLVFSGTAADDEEIYLGLWLTDADLTDITPPTDFNLIASYLEANRTLGLYHKTAASEGSATYTFTHSSTATMAGVGLAYSGETHDSTGTPVTAIATSTDTLSVGPATGATGDLMLALFYYSNNGVPTFTGGFTEQKRAPTKLSFADKTSTGTADTAINTLSKSVTRQSAILINIVPVAVGVTIANVDTDNIIQNEQQNVVTTVTGAGATQGTGSKALTSGAITSAFTIDSWADTSIQGDPVQGNIPFTTASNAVFVKVTTDSASTDSLEIEYKPEDNTAVIELLNPTEGDGQVDITGTPATTDQYHYTILYESDGVTPASATVSIDETGAIIISDDPADGTYKFYVRHWNQTNWDAVTPSTEQIVIIDSGVDINTGASVEVNTASSISAMLGALSIAVSSTVEVGTASAVDSVIGPPSSVNVAAAVETSTASAVGSVMGTLNIAVGSVAEISSVEEATPAMGAIVFAVAAAAEVDIVEALHVASYDRSDSLLMKLITIAEADSFLNDAVFPEWNALEDGFKDEYLIQSSAYIKVNWTMASSAYFSWDDVSTWPDAITLKALIARYADAIRAGLIYPTGETGVESTAPITMVKEKIGELETTTQYAQSKVPGKSNSLYRIDDQMKLLGFYPLNASGNLQRT